MRGFGRLGIVALALLAIPLLCVSGTRARAQGDRINLTDASDIGNELAGLIDAIVSVLNRSTCLSEQAKAQLQQQIQQLESQVSSDRRSLASAVALGSRTGERVGTRLNNYQYRLETLSAEIINFPTCPPPMIQIYVGGESIKNKGKVGSTERLAATGQITNQFSDSGDPLGFGGVIGFNVSPWRNWTVGPFVSFDWLNQTINRTFPGGFYLGTSTHWIITMGGKLGYDVAPGWMLYGLAGASFLNQDMNINFFPGLSSRNVTTPGFTAGIGTEYKPTGWGVFGLPVSLFVQYQHTWYNTATFNTPAPASPAFNYSFRREDDTVKFGVNIYLTPVSAPASVKPALITK